MYRRTAGAQGRDLPEPFTAPTAEHLMPSGVLGFAGRMPLSISGRLSAGLCRARRFDFTHLRAAADGPTESTLTGFL
jgi:hypothetical protein